MEFPQELKLDVDVTQQLIDEGIPGGAMYGPISLAIFKALPSEIKRFFKVAYVLNLDVELQFWATLDKKEVISFFTNNPPEVSAFIEANRVGPVGPLKITMEFDRIDPIED